MSSQLMSIVERAFQTARLRFGVCNPEGGSSWGGRWFGRCSHRCSTPRRISWTTFGRIFDEEGKKKSCWGQNYTESNSLSPIFSSSTSTRSKVVLRAPQRSERRSSLVCSLYLHLRHPLADRSLSSIAISSNPPGKSTQMTLNWRGIAL